jgi:nucleotide-binding universal stress UspA family protein
MKYKRILVAVDGSDTANLALHEAIQLTKNQKATLRIIYVVDESVIIYTDGYVDFETLWSAYKEEGQDLLSRINDQVKEEHIDFETCLVVLKSQEGRLAEKIITEAQDWHADLLVIGTHGRHGISRFFLGSVAERVLRIATMPVLLIRGQ